MRVAIVHDYLTHFGGAERVLAALMELFPNAPVYTLVHNPEQVGQAFDERRIRTSWLQHLRVARQPHRYFPLALMPLAAESFDLSAYDVVLSASHSFGKGVLAGPQTLHVSYCFTPTRYAWDDSHRYLREFSPNRLFRALAPAALSYVRLWDYYAAQRPHAYLTLSRYVARRIRKYYGREAAVLPPPVDVAAFQPQSADSGYYLVVSRLVPYKRIELAIAACERLGRPLKIVGQGPEEAALRRLAGKWTSFLGFVPDADLPLLYQGARALLFPQEEDFGITPVEAAASGKPTVAYGAGGATETVRAGVTGLFFAEQNTASLLAALQLFERQTWDAWQIRRHAEQFRREVFLRGVAEYVHNQWDMFKVQAR